MLRAEADGGLAYRRLVGGLHAAEDPDRAARRLAGIPAPGSGTMVHSTSWRYAADGQVVLTYAVAPDPDPALPAVQLEEVRIAYGESADRPSPVKVEAGQVAAHAVRHLAFLAEHDPKAAGPLARDPLLADALARRTPAPAGKPGG